MSQQKVWLAKLNPRDGRPAVEFLVLATTHKRAQLYAASVLIGRKEPAWPEVLTDPASVDDTVRLLGDLAEAHAFGLPTPVAAS